MSAQVTETAHGSLGLAVDDLLGMHRTMVTARLIDEAALRQNRMGRAPFVVPVSGHEGCQIGTAWPMRRGTDIWVPYYRDLGVVLVAGMTPEQIFLGVFSKATDPTSGGRQMPSHWSSKELGIVSHSSPIATQVPHAAGSAYAMKYRNEDAVVASWFGEGATSEGDWHEGLNIAAIHAYRSCSSAEQRVRDRAAVKQMVVADVASRAEVRDARVRGRRQRRPGVLPSDEGRPRPCSRRRLDDPDRVQDLPLPPHVGRRRQVLVAREVEERRHHDPIRRFATYLVDGGNHHRRPSRPSTMR